MPPTLVCTKLSSVVSSFNLTDTRVTESSTLIDLLFVTPTVIVKHCSTPANANHHGLQLSISTKSQMKRSKPVTRRIWWYTWHGMAWHGHGRLSGQPGRHISYKIMEICIPNATVKVIKILG